MTFIEIVRDILIAGQHAAAGSVLTVGEDVATEEADKLVRQGMAVVTDAPNGEETDPPGGEETDPPAPAPKPRAKAKA